MAECIITLFGIPKVTLGDTEVKLGAALPLLALLVLLRGEASVTSEDLAFLLRPHSVAEEPASFLKKRKQKIRTLLKMSLPNTLRPPELAPALLEQAWVDVVHFDEKIASADSREVREAVALRRRGPLLAGWPAPERVMRERQSREKSYQTALWRLVQEDRRENPEEAIRWIDLLLGLPALPDQSVLVLREDRLALEHNSFRAKASGSGKTTQGWRPPPLPSSPTELIGRDLEIDSVQALLSVSRLVTLCGTAGIGKTRLALAAAQRLQQSVSHGAAFADFSTATKVEQVSQRIGQALGLPEDKGRSWHASCLALLEDKSLILVWDNCEHLVEACADLAADILTRCPGVRILATSRESLRAYGEANCSVSALQEADAVQLFAARARLVKNDFRLTPENTPQVFQICRDLDGLPLAVELAAALAETLPLDQLASRLGSRFDLLSDGPRTGPVRHRSLWAAFAVSDDLLTPAEQALFHCLGVFSGSFTAEAATAVLPAGGLNDAPDLVGVSALLMQLVRKSLVGREMGGVEARYRQMETVRQYAGERLKRAGKWQDAQQRHRRHFLQVAEEAEPHLKGPEPKRWMDRLEQDGANLRAVFEWGLDETSLRIVCALLRFWRTRGYLQESRRWLERGARTGEGVPDALRARALNGAGSAAFALGDFQDAQALHYESLALSARAGAEAARAEALGSLGAVAAHLGDYDKAWELIEVSLSLWRQTGNREGIAGCLSYAGMVANYQCRYAEAQMLLEENLSIVQELQDAHSIASCLHNLGIVAFYQSDFSAARGFFERGLALWRPIGEKYSIAKALGGLGEVALRCGDGKSAQAIYHESLKHRQDAGDKYGIANSLNGLGEAAMHLGEYPAAAEFFEESRALRQQIGDIQSLAHSQHNLGQLALRQNDSAAAQAHFAGSLTLMRQNKDLYGIAHSLEGLAWAWLAAVQRKKRQTISAVRLLGAAARLRAALSSPHSPEDLEEHQRRLAAVRVQLGTQAFQAAWAEGQAMAWEEAISEALKENIG